ncbi:hypothetical protein SAMN04487765_0200 [Tenacibaculum sp. MAR_2010_89]|uniref:HNH endonuclease n=1 Tax=Tenacibaculum sp. MAR_2010_89 TaxID=1250198 RepID=UPI00089D8222|nr:HNH endonuclease [Tenacibaculum sp. MAR_2010_89]SED50743.1 hypothetical protein SAMN04487765_0200 [Tenacibaculum sp. MAR_2010_89]
MKTLLNKDFKQKTINTLRKRAGEMCSICKRLTSIPHTNPDKFINLGEAAHINGQNDAPNKRYDSSLTNEFLSSVANGIWLCRECHKKIDSDDKHYTVKFLNGLKEQHESDLFSGKLNYTKFTEYQKLEFEIYYLKDELSKMNNSELAIELKNAEKEKQQFKEKIEDIERSLLTTNKSLDEAKKCFFEKKRFRSNFEHYQ